jgi:hypothetical protein
MSEHEQDLGAPFRIYIITNPYNPRMNEELEQCLIQMTKPIIPEGFSFVDTVDQSDITIVSDCKPQEIILIAQKKLILVTAQNRNKLALNTYLTECQKLSGENWKNVSVVNINPNDQGKFTDKWWPLHVALFSLTQGTRLKK